MTKDEFDQLKKEMDNLVRKGERAKGKLEQLTTELQVEFGVNSIAKAKRLLKDLDEGLNSLQETIDKEEAVFAERWGHLLEE